MHWNELDTEQTELEEVFEEVHGAGREYGNTWPFHHPEKNHEGRYKELDGIGLSSGTIMGEGCSAMAIYDNKAESAYLIHSPPPWGIEGASEAQIVGETFSSFFYDKVSSASSADYYIVTSHSNIDEYLDNELTDPSQKAILGPPDTAELTVAPSRDPIIDIEIGEKEVHHLDPPQDKYSSPRKAV